jgi:hypothetical protein
VHLASARCTVGCAAFLTRAPNALRSSPERAAAAAAAAAELERLHAELALENYPGSEEVRLAPPHVGASAAR